LKPKFCLFGVKDSKSSLFFSAIIHCLVVGWKRASSFGFSALAFFVCRTTFGIADVDELTRRAFFSESTLPADSVSESMWARQLHDTAYLSDIMNWLSATRSGNAVLSAVRSAQI